MMDEFQQQCEALEQRIVHRNLTLAGVPKTANGETLDLWSRIKLYRQMASTRIETKTREVAHGQAA